MPRLLVGSVRWGAPGMQLRVTPTSLKRCVRYRCERKFTYETMDPTERRAIPIHEVEVLPAAVDLGMAFERHAVRQYARRRGGGCRRWAQ